ncbi:MAG: hypothetical protein JSV32_03290, partial [Dehalococcoidia bacterium]
SEPSGNAWNAYKTLVTLSATGDKTLAFPPTMDPKIWNILSETCQGMIKDPAFIAEADKMFPGLGFTAGETLWKRFEEEVVNADPDAVAWLKQTVMEKGGVTDD